MSMVVVNATAARSSGALSILRQFLDAIPEYGGDNEYIVFVDEGFAYKTIGNVRYVKQDTKTWLKRIWWDERGLKRWCMQHGIKPQLLVSLQNTGVNWDIPQVIYYHQLLPLSPKKWNPLKRKEVLLFCYKWFYSFFVNRYLTDRTHIIVQIPSIKEAFVHKFKMNEERVSVLAPRINAVDYSKIEAVDLKDGFVHFVYPATAFVYKNHIEIVRAVRWLFDAAPGLRGKLKVHFTLQVTEDKELYAQIAKWDLLDSFVFEGTMPFERLLGYYKSCDALLFPSYIESFGLPLLEAAGAGIPIIVADLPYAHDVVGKYDGVHFAGVGNSQSWGGAIKEICDKHSRYKPFVASSSGDWDKFFELLDDLK